VETFGSFSERPERSAEDVRRELRYDAHLSNPDLPRLLEALERIYDRSRRPLTRANRPQIRA
jgi:hypothetical protein